MPHLASSVRPAMVGAVSRMGASGMTANAIAPRPAIISVAFALWLGAVATAIAEVLVRFAIEPGGFAAAVADSGPEIPVRLTAYAILIALALLMRARRNFARHLLALIFGGLGLFSLIHRCAGAGWRSTHAPAGHRNSGPAGRLVCERHVGRDDRRGGERGGRWSWCSGTRLRP